MFAPTKRLMLRHGWPEDTPAVRAVLDDPRVAFQLERMRWSRPARDVEGYLARDRHPTEADLLIFRRGPSQPELIGALGLWREPGDDVHRFGLWLVPWAQGQGYAVEAGRVAMAFAQDSLGLATLITEGFGDAAADRALSRLGFVEQGAPVLRADGHGFFGPWRRYRCDLLTCGLAA